jgi:integrase/recombinase XerD
MSLAHTLFHWLSESILQAYLEDCLDREVGQRSVDWYAWHIRRARDWLEAQPGYHALSTLDPLALAAYYRSTRDLATNTRYYMVSCLRSFGKWLVAHGLDENPVAALQRPRRKKKLPRVLPPAEVIRLLKVLQEEPLRESCLVLLALDTGLRAGELANLRRADVDFVRNQLTVYGGKGDKDRVVYYSKTTTAALGQLLASHAYPHVFVSQQSGTRAGAPLTANGINQMLRRLAARHGFAKLNPHLLRRTCGTEYHANGVDLDVVGDQLGHADVATTRDAYARLADERRRTIIEATSPVERLMADCGILVPDWPRPEG